MTSPRYAGLLRVLLLALLVLGTTGCRDVARVPAGRTTPSACRLPGITELLRCAEVRVPEVRGSSATRTITLRVVVVPAVEPTPANDPWVELVGGPGNAATDFARAFVDELSYIRQTRDVLLVDQRGTGGSNPLYCAELSLHQLSSLTARFPPEAVDTCRAHLSGVADLAHYTTADAAEDLEAVRAALGYDRLNLFGSSYGTRIALEYMRRHAAHVRSAMLWGVVPPDFRRPRSYARDGQAALDLLLADCRTESACHAAFPAIAQELEALLARLDSTPVPITLRDPATGRDVEAAITHAGMAQAIWNALSYPDRARELPYVIHAAARGDYEPLRALDVATRPPRRRYHNAMHLSVVCGEEVLQNAHAELAAASVGSFMNAERALEYHEACVRWGVPRADSRTTDRVVSRVPTLLVSGAMDPITPPRWGDTAAAGLSNSRHVVVPHLSHEANGLTGSECLDSLFARFLSVPDPARLDTGCVGRIRPPAFRLPRRSP